MPKKTKADPTGQAANRNKAARQLVSRLKKAEREVKALFRSLPKTSRRQVKIVNAETTTVYDYQYDQQSFEQAVRYLLNDQLLETQNGVMPFDWYWQESIELPYRQGTAEEARDFNQMIAAAIASGVLIAGLRPQEVPVEQVLMSETYRSAVATAKATGFSAIKGLSEKTTAQVLQRINAGIQAGETPTVIAAAISERFGVAQSDAKRISDTEVNKAYNDARLRATNDLSDATGLRAGVIHISALTRTTRQTHADRHGNAYTVADQLQWWNEGANRISCKCTTKSILIGKNGEVIQAEMQDEIKSERSFFDTNND